MLLNILACVLGPLTAVICLQSGNRVKYIPFFLIGGFACLLSAYINSFLVELTDMPLVTSMIQITPILEEMMKLLPFLFLVFIVGIDKAHIKDAAIGVGCGFAIIENLIYINFFSEMSLADAMVRGLATGLMHCVCTILMGYGISIYCRRLQAKNVNRTLGWLIIWSIFCIISTFHAFYNLLIGGGGMFRIAGYVLSFILMACAVVFERRRSHLKSE